VQPVRKTAERIGLHRRSLPRLQAPENDMRAVKAPRRSLGHNGGWRAAKKDDARDAAGGSHLALPPPPGLWIGSGQFAPRDFRRRAPLVLHLGAHNSHGGRGMSGNSKDFVCCAHERASVIARLPAADRARIFSAKRSMTMTAEAARLLERCRRAARPIANTPALTKRTAGPHWAQP
jgi:hypothetical protein